MDKEEFFADLKRENLLFTINLAFCEFMGLHYIVFKNVSPMGILFAYIPVEVLIHTNALLNTKIRIEDFQNYDPIFYFKKNEKDAILMPIEFNV